MRLLLTACLVVTGLVEVVGDTLDDEGPRTDSALRVSPLRVEPAQIDLGQLLIGAHKDFAVVLRNTSRDKVTVGKIDSGCECIDLKAARLALDPGETTELSGRFRAGARAGPIRKRATLEVQAPDLQLVKIPFTGKVVATLLIEPESVTLQPQFVKGMAAECSVTIRNTGADVVQLSAGEQPDRVSLFLNRETLRPGESATAHIKASAEFANAENLRIAINTSHPHEKALYIALAVIPKPEIRLAPKVLRLGTLTKKDFLAKRPYKVLLSGAGIEEFEIVKVDCPSFLRAQLPTRQSNRPREILFHANDGTMQEPLAGFVEIKIEHKASGKSSVVKIPVSGTIADGE